MTRYRGDEGPSGTLRAELGFEQCPFLCQAPPASQMPRGNCPVPRDTGHGHTSPYTQDTVLVENLKSLLKTIPDAGQAWFQEPCSGHSVHGRAGAPEPLALQSLWVIRPPSGQILPLPIHREPLASPSAVSPCAASTSGHVQHSPEPPLSCSFSAESTKASLPRCAGRCGP